MVMPRTLAGITGAAAKAAAEAAAAEAAAAEAAEARAKAARLRPEPRVTLRRAAAGDAERIWEWSFSDELRAKLIGGRVVLYKDFARWFDARLGDRLTAMWIVEDAGANVGLVMIDRQDRQGLPRLTLALRRGARGRGIGRRALALVCEQWQRPVIAEVRDDNAAAVRCLEAAGFERTGERVIGAGNGATSGVKSGTTEVRCTYLWSP